MPQEQLIKETCDICGHSVTYADTTYVGGHPMSGWYHIKRVGGSTMLSELNKKREWSLCSNACVSAMINSQQDRHLHRNSELYRRGR